MSVLKLFPSSVRRDRAFATVDIHVYTNNSFRERERKIEREREREKQRERERERTYNFPVFIFKYNDIVQQKSANIQIAYMWKN